MDDTRKVVHDPNWKENDPWPTPTEEEGGGGASTCFYHFPVDSELGVLQIALGGNGGAAGSVEVEGGSSCRAWEKI
jgi:hypothetical protein